MLPLSEGDTLTVRARLSAGEKRAMFTRMYNAGVDGALKVNPMQIGLAVITAYLLDWSLTDHNGHQVQIAEMATDPLRIEELERVVDNLDPDDFDEIHAAIEQHESAVIQAIAAQKKTRSGATASSATSSSPPVSAGDTSGSGT